MIKTALYDNHDGMFIKQRTLVRSRIKILLGLMIQVATMYAGDWCCCPCFRNIAPQGDVAKQNRENQNPGQHNGGFDISSFAQNPLPTVRGGLEEDEPIFFEQESHASTPPSTPLPSPRPVSPKDPVSQKVLNEIIALFSDDQAPNFGIIEVLPNPQCDIKNAAILCIFNEFITVEVDPLKYTPQLVQDYVMQTKCDFVIYDQTGPRAFCRNDSNSLRYINADGEVVDSMSDSVEELNKLWSRTEAIYNAFGQDDQRFQIYNVYQKGVYQKGPDANLRLFDVGNTDPVSELKSMFSAIDYDKQKIIVIRDAGGIFQAVIRFPAKSCIPEYIDSDGKIVETAQESAALLNKYLPSPVISWIQRCSESQLVVSEMPSDTSIRNSIWIDIMNDSARKIVERGLDKIFKPESNGKVFMFQVRPLLIKVNQDGFPEFVNIDVEVVGAPEESGQGLEKFIKLCVDIHELIARGTGDKSAYLLPEGMSIRSSLWSQIVKNKPLGQKKSLDEVVNQSLYNRIIEINFLCNGVQCFIFAKIDQHGFPEFVNIDGEVVDTPENSGQSLKKFIQLCHDIGFCLNQKPGGLHVIPNKEHKSIKAAIFDYEYNLSKNPREIEDWRSKDKHLSVLDQYLQPESQGTLLTLWYDLYDYGYDPEKSDRLLLTIDQHGFPEFVNLEGEIVGFRESTYSVSPFLKLCWGLRIRNSTIESRKILIVNMDLRYIVSAKMTIDGQEIDFINEGKDEKGNYIFNIKNPDNLVAVLRAIALAEGNQFPIVLYDSQEAEEKRLLAYSYANSKWVLRYPAA